MTRAIASVSAGVLAVIVAGCSGGDPAGEQSTRKTTTEIPATSSSHAEDPFAVPNPLDLTAVSAPCKLLTPQQVKKLGAGQPEPNGKSPWGQVQCKWRNQQMTINIAPETVQQASIKAAAYRYSEDGKPTHEIRGYPAVNGGVTESHCGTFVGVSKTAGFSVNFTVGYEGRNDPAYKDPCAWSDKIAGMVLKNLPPA